MDLEPPPKSPMKKLCLGGSGISCGWNSSPIISGRLWLNQELSIAMLVGHKKKKNWVQYDLPEFGGNGKSLDLRRCVQKQSMSPVTEAERLGNSIEIHTRKQTLTAV